MFPFTGGTAFVRFRWSTIASSSSRYTTYMVPKLFAAPPIQKAVIAVKREKQPTGLAKSDKTNMNFFDARILLSTILSTTKSNVLHTGMADIVDSPSEYWQSHFWGIEYPNLLSRLCGISGTKHQYFLPTSFSTVVRAATAMSVIWEDGCPLGTSYFLWLRWKKATSKTRKWSASADSTSEECTLDAEPLTNLASNGWKNESLLIESSWSLYSATTDCITSAQSWLRIGNIYHRLHTGTEPATSIRYVFNIGKSIAFGAGGTVDSHSRRSGDRGLWTGISYLSTSKWSWVFSYGHLRECIRSLSQHVIVLCQEYMPCQLGFWCRDSRGGWWDYV